MFHADTLFDNEESFGLPEIEERDLSASPDAPVEPEAQAVGVPQRLLLAGCQEQVELPQPGRQILLWLPQPAGPAEKLCGRPSVREVPLLQRQERQGKNTGSARTPDG